MPYSSDADLEERLLTRLDPLEFGAGWRDPPPFGDYDLNPHARPAERPILKPAAVLAPIIRRPEGYVLLLTERAAEMSNHAGQVAFPGGRIEESDDGPVGAALREAHEEIGLDPSFVRPVGALPPWETATGFTVAPIVAMVEPGFTLTLDPREVASVFEAPCADVFTGRSHARRSVAWRGSERTFWVIEHPERYIWGATAGMIRALYERLYSDELHP
jgi:8-oxo-dGTP pyrophosphatase MutT (NUDIX family)